MLVKRIDDVSRGTHLIPGYNRPVVLREFGFSEYAVFKQILVNYEYIKDFDLHYRVISMSSRITYVDEDIAEVVAQHGPSDLLLSAQICSGDVIDFHCSFLDPERTTTSSYGVRVEALKSITNEQLINFLNLKR